VYYARYLILYVCLLLLCQMNPLNLSSDVEIVSGLVFPLGPPTSMEPPKEKPPPPPTELSDDEVPPVSYIKIYVLLIYVIFKKGECLLSGICENLFYMHIDNH